MGLKSAQKDFQLVQIRAVLPLMALPVRDLVALALAWPLSNDIRAHTDTK